MTELGTTGVFYLTRQRNGQVIYHDAGCLRVSPRNPQTVLTIPEGALLCGECRRSRQVFKQAPRSFPTAPRRSGSGRLTGRWSWRTLGSGDRLKTPCECPGCGGTVRSEGAGWWACTGACRWRGQVTSLWHEVR